MHSDDNPNSGNSNRGLFMWLSIGGIGLLLLLFALLGRPADTAAPPAGSTPITDPAGDQTDQVPDPSGDVPVIVTSTLEPAAVALTATPPPDRAVTQPADAPQLPEPAIALVEPTSCTSGRVATYTGNAVVPFRWQTDRAPDGNDYLEIRINGRSIGRVPNTARSATEWTWGVPVSAFFEEGVSNYTWEVVHMSADQQTVLAGSTTGCLAVSGGPGGSGDPVLPTVAPSSPVPPTVAPPYPPPDDTPYPPPPAPTTNTFLSGDKTRS